MYKLSPKAPAPQENFVMMKFIRQMTAVEYKIYTKENE